MIGIWGYVARRLAGVAARMEGATKSLARLADCPMIFPEFEQVEELTVVFIHLHVNICEHHI